MKYFLAFVFNLQFHRFHSKVLIIEVVRHHSWIGSLRLQVPKRRISPSMTILKVATSLKFHHNQIAHCFMRNLTKLFTITKIVDWFESCEHNVVLKWSNCQYVSWDLNTLWHRVKPCIKWCYEIIVGDGLFHTNCYNYVYFYFSKIWFLKIKSSILGPLDQLPLRDNLSAPKRPKLDLPMHKNVSKGQTPILSWLCQKQTYEINLVFKCNFQINLIR